MRGWYHRYYPQTRSSIAQCLISYSNISYTHSPVVKWPCTILNASNDIRMSPSARLGRSHEYQWDHVRKDVKYVSNGRNPSAISMVWESLIVMWRTMSSHKKQTFHTAGNRIIDWFWSGPSRVRCMWHTRANNSNNVCNSIFFHSMYLEFASKGLSVFENT